MNLTGIVAISGKPGLWRALAQNKTGYILESLDALKTKLIVNVSTTKLAALNDITIFGLEGDIKLTDIFERMKSVQNIPDAKADGTKLRAFFWEVAPDHDEEKVYASDMKKVINWYHAVKELPLFNEAEPAVSVVDKLAVAEDVVKPVPEVASKTPDDKEKEKANDTAPLTPKKPKARVTKPVAKN